MVKVSREEAMEIRKKLPHATVSMTNRQGPSRKKHYYVEESWSVTKLLNEMRNRNVVSHYE